MWIGAALKYMTVIIPVGILLAVCIVFGSIQLFRWFKKTATVKYEKMLEEKINIKEMKF